MALSKSMLEGMGLTKEQIKAIIDGHEESLDYYQGEIEKYKKTIEDGEKKLAKVQNDLNNLKKEADDNDSKNPYKVKYEALKEEFDKFKADEKAKETKATKTEAFKALLKECGVSDKRIGSVVKVSDIESIELDEDGKIKDADKLKASVKEEWSDFIPTQETKGAQTSTPPGNTGGRRSKEEILAIKDTSERQQAMLENKDLFL